ncbi:MAG: AAA family ATPase [Candidatus Pacearchaeota archaeon]
MRIKKLKLRNIRSYEEQEIEFPEGSLLLSGDIGSGKTSILLAIEYALFGLQPGQKGSALLRNNSNLGEVVLEFEIDGKEVVIERRLKRESKSVSNDYSAITIDGQKIESSVTELKTKILNLLQYPPEFIKKNNLLYRYTVYTPQEQMKQIILEDPEVRLNILGYVFGIDKYKRIRENLTILLNRLKEDSKLLQGEIKSLDEDKVKLNSIKDLLLELQEKTNKKTLELAKAVEKRKIIENQIKELEQKIKEKENFEKEVEKTKIMISSKKESILMFERELFSLTKTISEQESPFSEEKFHNVLKSLVSKKEEIDKLNSKYIEILSRLKTLEQNRQLNNDKKNRIFQIDFCPTCLQNVPYAHKHNILNETERELSNIAKEMATIELERKETKLALDKLKLELPKLEEEKTALEIAKSKVDYIEKSKKRIEEIKKLKEILEKDIFLLSSHIDKLKESILEFSKFTNLYKISLDELNKSLNEEKNYEIALAELKKEIELINKEIIQTNKIIEEKENSKKRLTRILELSDWLSNNFLSMINLIERNVMIKLRIEFARLFNRWFHILAGDLFEVHLDENFTPLIVQGEIEMDYAFLSGGERTAVALAYRLALNQTINSILSNIKTKDIIILDEPTDGFSDLQLDKMREVLSDLNIPQLIIVSHEQKIEGFVDNVLRLKKEGLSSKLEQGAIVNQKT